MKLEMKKAKAICCVIRSSKPADVFAAVRQGMSLDELIRKLARKKAEVIKTRCEKELLELQRRVEEFLSRADIRKEVENQVRSYFRRPNRAPAGTDCRTAFGTKTGTARCEKRFKQQYLDGTKRTAVGFLG